MKVRRHHDRLPFKMTMHSFSVDSSAYLPEYEAVAGDAYLSCA